ncbi:GHKL domain-containing protein [Ilyomonas limi]|uniref:histidine kinase n=1 Tax=Ilyomonas limi TaxID=2575867 RepID=A0A4U3L333_9BACT|nr:ATP-binding protein [Ilyomonas limi]TKK69330.1 GHKL domain-containing protein [Ilyomonas limi]
MNKIFVLLIIICFSFAINSCNERNRNIPLPKYVIQSKTIALHWSAPQKIRFYDTSKLIVTTKKLDFDALPEEVYDSTVAQPFSKKPVVTHFNWDSLPRAAFNYNTLPSKPFHFKTYAVTPEIIKAGPLVFKQMTNQPFFEITNAEDIIGKQQVDCTLEDKAGFIWIASRNGLFRYDGENLVRYLKARLQINSLREDDKGQIWVSFFKYSSGERGLFVLNTEKNVLQELDAKQMQMEGSIPWDFAFDSYGKLWVETHSGMRIIDLHKNVIKSFTVKQGLSADTARSLLQDEEKNMWITTNNGLDIINAKQNTISYFKKENGLPSDTTWRIAKDEEKRIWVDDAHGGLSVIDRHAGTINHLDWTTTNFKPTLQTFYVYNMMDDGNGNMLVDYLDYSTRTHDLKIINPKNNTTREIRFPSEEGWIGSSLLDKNGQIWLSNYGNLEILNKNGYDTHHAGNTNITALAEDARNNIWISDVGKGIKILNPVTGKAKILNKAAGLSNDTLGVKCIDGKIYVATPSGLDIIDSGYTTITYLGKMPTAYPVLHKGNIWLQNFRTGSFEAFNLEKKLRFHVDISLGKQDENLQQIQDKEANILLCTGSNVLGVIDSGSAYIRYTDTVLSAESTVFKPMCSDTLGNTWIAIDTVLFKINKRRDSVTMFSPQNGLFNSYIKSLNEYNGCIYSGTFAGVNIITPPNPFTGNTWCIQSLGKNEGFSANLGEFQNDGISHNGIYWWVGNGGITFLPPLQLNKPVLSKTYITSVDVYNEPQHFSNKRGEYTVTGDTLWDANTNNYYLKGQKLNMVSNAYGNKMKWDSITGPYNMPVNLTMPYDMNNLQFHFVQSNEGTGDAEYRYYLEGYDSAWSETTTNTSSRNYFELPAGKYTFKVSSLNSYEWSKPAEFSFTIASPWWKSWWAFVIYFVLIALIYAAFRSFNLKRQNKLLEVKVNQRTAQLNQSLKELKSTQAQLIQSEKMASLGELTAGIAHEIQNPLNFVNNFSEVNVELIEELKSERSKVKHENGEPEDEILNDIEQNLQKILHHGKRADSIVKGMLQHSRANSGKKELTEINALVDECVRLSYHGMRAKSKEFNATININLDESIGRTDVVPQDISRVLLNLLNNAFYAVDEKKKSPQSLKGSEGYEPTVSVCTKRLDGKVEIQVKDNGNGISRNIVDKIFQPFFTTKPTGQGTGLGLSLSYDIVKAHGGEIKVESKEGEGTALIIQLPA